MSVPSSQRKQGKLEVLMKALDLTIYTLKITSNKNVFISDYQRSITDKINEIVLDIYMSLWTANNILVKAKEDKEERIGLQKHASIQCNNLLAIMMVAQRAFHLSTKRIKYWGQKTLEVRTLIRAWTDSDNSRYSY